ncbi:MAG: potassium channel protein, partial [Desulfobacula sp.]|nr:potassium channel protein [Desulfobacula sp.]
MERSILLYFLKNFIRVGLKRKGILLVFSCLALLLTSSLLIKLVEPSGSALTHFDQALWWSIVTSTTV